MFWLHSESFSAKIKIDIKISRFRIKIGSYSNANSKGRILCRNWIRRRTKHKANCINLWFI